MTLVSIEPIWKASTRLADGREIVYFDEAPGLDRVLARDTRPLPPRRPPRPARRRQPAQGYCSDRPSRASAGTRWPGSGW